MITAGYAAAALLILAAVLRLAWPAFAADARDRAASPPPSPEEHRAPPLPRRVPGRPVDGEPLDPDEMAWFTGCGMASLAAGLGLDLDAMCPPCADGQCGDCDGRALASGACRCGHSVITARRDVA